MILTKNQRERFGDAFERRHEPRHRQTYRRIPAYSVLGVVVEFSTAGVGCGSRLAAVQDVLALDGGQASVLLLFLGRELGLETAVDGEEAVG